MCVEKNHRNAEFQKIGRKYSGKGENARSLAFLSLFCINLT